MKSKLYKYDRCCTTDITHTWILSYYNKTSYVALRTDGKLTKIDYWRTR